MTGEKPKTLWRRLSSPGISPQGLVMRAGLIAAAFVAVHLAGLRENAGTLTGTSAGSTFSMISGVVYGSLYLATVFLVPALVIGAGILFISLLVFKDPQGPASS